MLNVNTPFGKITYFIQPKEIINTKSHKWSLVLTLSNLKLNDLMFIFNAILHENTLIFFSKSECLLT